ncbi:MAG: ATPase domain-containing protein [Nanoarchaeota archaeon]
MKKGKGKVEHSKKSKIVNPVKIKKEKSSKDKTSGKIDLSALKADIEKALNSGESKTMNHVEQINVQRAPLTKIKDLKFKYNKQISKYVNTGIPGFDDLFQEGIPKGSNVLVAGGAGSGKTIFCLQTLAYHAAKGEKCFYMSFEESEDKLKQHMKEFGWDADKMIKAGNLKIERINPFEITRNVDAMLAKEKGELLIEIEPVILPKNFKPDFIVLDSLTAIASAFTGKEDSYRIYIEQLFRFFERLGSTSFLIAETKQIPEVFSTSGVEEFLADGVIVLYNIKRGDIRENAVEILKMRGEKHQKKIVAMQITDKGLIIYPEQEVFGGVGG